MVRAGQLPRGVTDYEIESCILVQKYMNTVSPGVVHSTATDLLPWYQN
jgi:hypothetical protein